MASFNRFDVLLVRFPFSERGAFKRRPAVILSKPGFQASHAHSVMAMITTASVTKWPSDIPITEMAGTGLRETSFVRLKLFTLARELALGRLGMLAASDQVVVDRALHDLFGP